jgi:CRP-like cAMP-binding protein
MIKDIIQSISPMSSNSLAEIENLIEVKLYEKGETFIVKNKHNNKEYFVLEGICRSYLLNPDGEEITISFFNKNEIISPYTTRTVKGVSTLNFQALTHIRLAELNAGEFENLMIVNLEIREFGNAVLRHELNQKVEKEISLASLTAKERLINFREKYPLLENQIPHNSIATYLGITNISLSRLRRDLVR